MRDQLNATISDFIGNQMFLNMFRASLRPSSRGHTAFSLPMVICPVVTVVMLESRLASCVHSLPASLSIHEHFYLTLYSNNRASLINK